MQARQRVNCRPIESVECRVSTARYGSELMEKVAVKDIYLEALEALEDIEEEVEAAVRRHAIERISDKIASLRAEDHQLRAEIRL